MLLSVWLVTVPMPQPTPRSISLLELNDLSITELVSDKFGDIDDDDDKDEEVVDELNELKAGVNESDNDT